MTASRPRVVFLNRCFWPDNEATGQLLSDLCDDLKDNFDIHVVCGQPNSPIPGAQYTKVGVQVRNGITLHRLVHTRYPKRIPAGRVLNLTSFARATKNYLRQTQLDANVIVSETDPFLLPMVGAAHAARCGAKHVCYLQDIYPDVAESVGQAKSGWITRQIRRRLQDAYRTADRVIVLGQCMQRRLASPPWNIDRDKTEVIPNWADCDLIHPEDRNTLNFRQTHRLENRFVVMHSGNMGLTQQLDRLIQAAADPAWPENAVLVLVGDGAKRTNLEKRAGALAGDRIRFLPYQPRSELSRSLAAADLHVVSMHNNIAGCLCPSKLYGILAAGRPVLAIAPKATDLSDVVEQKGIGWCCQPSDISQIAKAIADAASKPNELSSMGQRARDLAVSTYDRKVVTARFADLLRGLTETSLYDSSSVGSAG